MSEKEVRKVCNSVSLATTQWKLAVAQGRPLLSSLLESVYPMPGEESGEEERKDDWQPEVQKLCVDLQQLLIRMEEVLASLEDVAEKASGLEDLVSLSQQTQLSESLHPSRPRPRAQDLLMNSSAPPRLSTLNASITLSLDSSILQPSSLSNWVATLLSAHSRQLEVNRVVARTFCHVESREEAQYLTALWNVQPAFDTEAQVAEVAIETTLKSCAPP